LDVSELMPSGYIVVKEGKDLERRENPATDAQGTASAPYIKDRAPARNVGCSQAPARTRWERRSLGGARRAEADRTGRAIERPGF
jgi:hypothetical protein